MQHVNARRLVRARWRDGRLWLGVALIIVSMVVGSRLLSHSDDRITVWRATHDLSAGAMPVDLEPVAVSLGDADSDYVPATQAPSGVLVHPVAAGELLPVASLGVADATRMRVITLAVEPLHSPVGLLPGDRVDIWATANESSIPGASRLVESSAAVTAIAADSMGVGGEIGVAVEIPEERAEALIAAVRGGVIDLVSVPIEAQT
ncbi:MAG: hypothetical protein ACR2JS_02610 [Candidatus Nanopelagicales bacterium]